MRVELASQRDATAIADLNVWLVARERQTEIVRESITNGGCFVAFVDDRLAGFITWDRGFFNRPFVRLLAVEVSLRRRNVGLTLLRRVESAATPSGELFVSTEEINAPMRAMLAAAGYAPSGSIDNVNPPGNAELVFYKRLA